MSSRKIGRRELLRAIGATGAAVAFGCGSSSGSPTSPTTTTTTTTNNAACAVTPTETIGPYPSLVDLFRSDIREGKSGTLLALTIKVATGIFADSLSSELVTPVGDSSNGYTAAFQIGVAL